MQVFKQNLILISIDDSNLLIGQLKKVKNKFLLIDINERKLNSSEFINGRPFNLSLIFLSVKNYLEKNKLKHCKTIFCITDLEKKEWLQQTLTILQIALILGKLNLKIKKILDSNILKKGLSMTFFINKKELDTKLDFFKRLRPEKKTSPLKWLFAALCLSILILITSLITQKINHQKLNFLKIESKKLLKETLSLKSKTIKLQQLKLENEKLDSQISKVTKYQKNIEKQLNILIFISKIIPKKCHLTKINTNLKTKKPQINIEGSAFSQQKVVKFQEKLTQNEIFKKVQLVNIQRVKKDEKAPEYAFKIRVKIKEA